LNIEELERRLVPAILLNPTTLLYTDVDGDRVTVQVSGPAGPQFTLDEFTFVSAGQGEQLQQIDLTSSPAGFAGSNLTIQVKRQSGDGLANIGYINASGIDLGNVTLKGDLGRIDAGTGVGSTPAIADLHVHSLGAMGLSTQPDGGSLQSNIMGPLGDFRVDTNIQGAALSVFAPAIGGPGPGPGPGDGPSTSTTSPPLITQMTVGGSIIGSDDFESGLISCDGDIGTANVAGSLQGGAGIHSGGIQCSGHIGEIMIGSLVGGNGTSSGSIHARGIDDLTVNGSVVAGAGFGSGSIQGNDLGNVTIMGSVTGTAVNPAQITAVSQIRTEERIIERQVPEMVWVEVCNRNGVCHEQLEKVTVTRQVPITVEVESRGQINNLSIQGNVDFANIVAGFDGQIGSVWVGGHWHASNLAAAVSAGPDGFYGTTDDVLRIRAKDESAGRIGSITIMGGLLGSSNPDEHFGIAAREIDSFFANSTGKIQLHPGPSNDDFLLGLTGNFRLREVPVGPPSPG
jgi:hypothetical protein